MPLLYYLEFLSANTRRTGEEDSKAKDIYRRRDRAWNKAGEVKNSVTSLFKLLTWDSNIRFNIALHLDNSSKHNPNIADTHTYCTCSLIHQNQQQSFAHITSLQNKYNSTSANVTFILSTNLIPIMRQQTLSCLCYQGTAVILAKPTNEIWGFRSGGHSCVLLGYNTT